MKEFSGDNYITIPGFAITELKLSGNELVCYSLIYGFSQDGESDFFGSLSYLSSALNITKANAKAVVDRLIDKGLVEKIVVDVQGVKFCRYKANRGGGIETVTPLSNQQGGGIETITNNNNNKETLLFTSKEVTNREKKRGTTENLCLFANSRYADKEAFVKEFPQDKFPGIDINYYYYAVADWSASGGKKKRDWIATARNFMRADKEQGRLRMLGATSKVKDGLDYLDELVRSFGR